MTTDQHSETAVLQATHLTKHFPIRERPLALHRVPVRAVEDVSLSLAKGSVTAVVGESGSGKSTLARMLARLIVPTSGDVMLRGEKMPASGVRRDYTRQVQLVLQDPFFDRAQLGGPVGRHKRTGKQRQEGQPDDQSRIRWCG